MKRTGWKIRDERVGRPGIGWVYYKPTGPRSLPMVINLSKLHPFFNAPLNHPADPRPRRRGKGGAHSAAVKGVLEVEVATGQFTELEVMPALDNDKTSSIAAKPLPKGALLLEDMGFLCGQRLQEYEAQGAYFL